MFLEDGIRIVSKDDGVSFDLSSDEVGVGSLAGYTVKVYRKRGSSQPSSDHSELQPQLVIYPVSDFLRNTCRNCEEIISAIFA